MQATETPKQKTKVQRTSEIGPCWGVFWLIFLKIRQDMFTK